jgi:hypothetical protein
MLQASQQHVPLSIMHCSCCSCKDTAAATASYYKCPFLLTCYMLQEHQQAKQLPQLPAGILQQVLSHVPLQQRLGSCSLASRSMHAAAVAATEEISLAELNSQQKALDLCQWLARYGSEALRHFRVQRRTWQQPRQLTLAPLLTLALPSGLQQLQSLTLSNVELPAAPDSCVHPKLTSLSLERCAVRPSLDMFAWVARQLVHLTGLQHLQLHWLYPHADRSEAGIASFEVALGSLQQLTSLSLQDASTITAALATVSSLRQLQRLQLDSSVGTPEQPLQLHWLPSSLTFVSMGGCFVSCVAAGSNSSCGWKLPMLQHLELTGGVYGFEPALLKQMPQLRVFSFTPLEPFLQEPILQEDGPLIDREQQLVQVLPQLQHLQQLRLQALRHWPSPSSCASLTASSELTGLVLMECRLPAGAVQHMFAAGQQLQQLQQIEVVASDMDQDDICHLQQTLTYIAGILRPDSLNLGPGDLAKLASCCPRLRELSVVWCDLSGPEQDGAAVEAAPLLQLAALTKLGVAGRYWNDRVSEMVLARMTGGRNSSHCVHYRAAGAAVHNSSDMLW